MMEKKNVIGINSTKKHNARHSDIATETRLH